MQTGNKVYFALYQLLEKKDTSPEEALAVASPKHSKAIIKTARKHLHRRRLKNLRTYESNKLVKNRLIHRIRNIQILFNKGFMEWCFAELARATEVALKIRKIFVLPNLSA